ncbi:MAG: protein kinase [Pirellulaceae bacterium]|nr:protein kinase [Pirellulaceae bacterium]
MKQSSIDRLSSEHQERVAEIVETCMVALEQGRPLEVDRIVAAHPEFAEPLNKCLASLRTLHEAVHCTDDTVPSHPKLQVGGRLGDFVLGDMIGRGGMGFVYAATQCSLDRPVAIKLLPMSASLQPMQLKRFLLEAKAVAQLQHPNIVPIYSVGENAGIHYHAMQLIDGHSLDKGDRTRWMSGELADFLNVAISIADALQHAHDCGIIHRDVKPSNLLVDKSGKVWITDFGLARCTRETGLTLSGDLLGTVNYMSPEQAMGKPLDQRTDVYSFGVTLYEMLTGRQAFDGKASPDVCRRIERDEPVCPRKLNRRIPYDLETVILKAMSKDREERYSTAADLAFDLMAVRDGRPIAGRRPSWLQLGLRWLKQHKLLATVAAIGGAATMAALLVGTTQVWLARQDLQLALTKSEERRLIAQETYWQSRNLLNRWSSEVISPLAEVPGAETIRSQMLADTIEYYESFLTECELPEHLQSDPELMSDIATARLHLAAALVQADDHAKAQSSYEKAIVAFERIDRPQDLRKLAIARNDLGLVYLNQGEFSLAVEQLTESLRVHEQYIARTHDASRVDEAATHANLARALGHLGNQAQKALELDKAATLYREQLACSPKRNDLLSEFGTVLDDLALSRAEDQLSEALRYSREAVAIHEQCVNQSSAASVKYSQRLGASQHNFAVLLAKYGQIDDARAQFREAIATKSKLTRTHPNWPSHWRELATSHRGLAELECQLGQWFEGRQLFELAKENLEHLVRQVDARPNPSHQLALASVLADIAKIDARHSHNAADELLAEIRKIVDWVVASGIQTHDIQRQTRELRSDIESLERLKHLPRSNDRGAKS